jgi:hypothetical protein
MARLPDKRDFKEWADKADTTNLAPHRERVTLWEELCKLVKTAGPPGHRYVLRRKNFQAFKNYLTAYQSKVADNDAIGMAFQKSLDEVLEELDEDADDDVEEVKSEIADMEDEGDRLTLIRERRRKRQEFSDKKDPPKKDKLEVVKEDDDGHK